MDNKDNIVFLDNHRAKADTKDRPRTKNLPHEIDIMGENYEDVLEQLDSSATLDNKLNVLQSEWMKKESQFTDEEKNKLIDRIAKEACNEGQHHIRKIICLCLTIASTIKRTTLTETVALGIFLDLFRILDTKDLRDQLRTMLTKINSPIASSI